MPTPPLRTDPVVVLGCGSIGRRHAHNLIAAGVRQLQLVDIDASAAEALAAECGATVAASLDEALVRGAGSVFVCTPTDRHVADARRALDGGADVFIEKPLSHSTDGVEDLRRAADASDAVSMVGCNMRFHPGPQTVKRLIDAGAIGRVLAARIHAGSFLPRWRPWQDYRRSYSASCDHGGAILDCIHEIDLAWWYFGPAVLHSAAVVPAVSIGLDTDGLAELLLEHERGVLTSLHVNFVQRDYSRSCLIIGDEGTIEWVFRDREVRHLGPDGSLVERIGEPAGWDMNQMYVDELAHFLHAAERRIETMNPIQTGAAVLNLALGARARRREATV